jgi:hypothetical protein
VHSPYSLNYGDTFAIAQLCAGLMIAALLLFWRTQSVLARACALAGVGLTVVAIQVAPFLKSIGHPLVSGVAGADDPLTTVLALSAGCGTIAAFLAPHRVLALVSLGVEIVLWKVSRFVTESDFELAALHLAWLGVLAGLFLRLEEKRTGRGDEWRAPSAPATRTHDAVLFALSSALSAFVCVFVMHRGEGSADEWAYTFQAASFAKGHMVAGVPLCQKYLRSFYVFEHEGRLFSLYTPGWPLFLAPFVWIHAIWLGGPAAMGLLAVGLARLGRSAWRASGRDEPQLPRFWLASAGTWAAGLVATGVMLTINAGSRYPHIFAMALYAWALESMMQIAAPPVLARRARERARVDPRALWGWGIALGATAALFLATRPAEGALMGVGIAVAFVVLLIRRRVNWRSLVGAAAAFAVVGFAMLVILRVQVGTWFTTAYSLNAIIYPWNVTKYDMPKPDQWKYGLPLATSSYCWWPCCWALGLAGLASLRRGATELLVAFAVGSLVYLVYFEWLDTGQRGMGVDWGYGPRYLMLLLVPLAIGCGLAIAPLVAAALRPTGSGGRIPLAAGGPFALVLVAIVCGLVRVVPLVWPTASEHARRHSGLRAAIDEMHLENAVVLAKPGTTGFDVLDITKNLPVDLYPDQDAIIAVDKGADAVQCLRREFPSRTFYSAQGVDPVHIAPYGSGS